MAVSVLLPVYNGAATLRQAIESILRQDDPEFELLIVDDASTDASTAIAREYVARDRRVRLIAHRQNVGLAETLNDGLEAARHELVLRMDQDDEALPARIRRQRDFMAANSSIAASGSWVLHMGVRPELDRLVQVPQSPREVAATLQRENCLYHPSVAMRRSVVLERGGYRAEFRNAEDYELWLRLSRLHDLANVPEPLLRYRFSVKGMTLGRKWEQLYYVHLAQTVHAGGTPSLEVASARARAALAAIDRRSFMRQVARGTVAELIALGHLSDAAAVSIRFAREVGLFSAGRLVGSVATGYAGARLASRERDGSPAAH